MPRKKSTLTLGKKNKKYYRKGHPLTPNIKLKVGSKVRSVPSTPVAKRFCHSRSSEKRSLVVTTPRSPSRKKVRRSLCSPAEKLARRFGTSLGNDEEDLGSLCSPAEKLARRFGTSLGNDEEDLGSTDDDVTGWDTEEEDPIENTAFETAAKDDTQDIETGAKEAQKVLQELDSPDIVAELIKAINQGNLDPNKLTFKVIFETLQFLNHADIRSMRYSAMSMDFWKLFLNKCGGSAIRLLSGWKQVGSILTTKDRGKAMPGSESNIILAIPNVSRLLTYNIEDTAATCTNDKKPGIHDDLLSWLSQNQTPGSSFILSFDGRLVQANSGTVDLGGLELEGPTAQQREDHECQELDLCKELKANIDDFEVTDQDKVGSMRAIITLLSNKKQHLRVLKSKKEYALKLAQEGIKGDWKKSKYARLISHLMALLHQIDTTMSLLDDSTEGLGKASAEISGVSHLWAEGPVVDMTKQENYRKLVPQSAEAEKSEETLYWQQRGENWKQLRNSVPITGSQLHKGAGLDTLAEAKKLFKRWKDGESLPEPSEKVKTAMEAGVRNEPHAVATIVSKFLPSLFPTVEFREVGCCELPMGSINIVDSPDGSAHGQQSNLKSPSRFAIEIKHVTTELPRQVRHYNILQCLAHCEALQTDSCMLFYHTETSTALYEVRHDRQLWEMITDQIESIYGAKGTIPKRVTPDLKCLRERVRSHAEAAELVAEFRSTINVEGGIFIREEDSPYYLHVPQNSNELATLNIPQAVKACDKAIAALKECHDLEKPYAKEVLQFLLCDADRMWSKNQIYGCPAAYFLKGASLCAAQAHALVGAVLAKAEEKGLYIPAVSADGAFEYMVGRDSSDNPNTTLAFQKRLWKEMLSIEKRSLATIVSLQISDAWNVPVEKMKISQVGMTISVERHTKRNCPRTATWVLKSNDNDDKKSKKKGDKSESDKAESDPFEQLLLSFPDDVRRNLEDFCEENPLFREQLSKHPDAEWLSDAQGDRDRNARNATSILHMDRSEADDMNAEVSTENQQVNPPECSQSSEVHEEHVSSHILEHVKQKILEKTRLQWDPEIETRAFLQDPEMLNKLNLDVLKDILRSLKVCAKGSVKISMRKSDVIKQIVSITNGVALDVAKVRTRQPKSLLQLSEAAVKACPGRALAASLANHVAKERRLDWEAKRTCPRLRLLSDVGDAGENLPVMIECFYAPPLSKQGYLQGTVIDPHHIRTNVRGSVLRNQVNNVDLDGLKKVAEGGRTKLKSVMLTECVDMQSKSMCDVLFSEEVATELYRLGYKSTADFVMVMHGWYQANDRPGLDAKERVLLRLRMRDWLLEGINFDVYPPPGRYIKGIYVTTWEAFVSQIDLSIQAARVPPEMHRSCTGIPCTGG